MTYTIEQRLKRIENYTLLAAKDALSMTEAAAYTGLSKAYLYKLVHQRKIPFYKSAGGKQTYFAKSELTQWLLKHRVSTIEEAEQKAIAYVVNNPRNGRKRPAINEKSFKKINNMEDYEKKYKEALERAKKYKEYDFRLMNAALDDIFPELRESEDEKIRKELIEFIDINTISTDERHDRWIAWFEKHGEKKPEEKQALIDKACKWLDEQALSSSFINSFKKEMEEGEE